MKRYPSRPITRSLEPPEIKKLLPNETGDVVAWISPVSNFHRVTNIPHVIRHSDDFAWGYSGSGPSDFALNILFHFTKGDRLFANKHCTNFREELIAPRDQGEPMTIPEVKVLAWIEERRLLDPIKESEVERLERGPYWEYRKRLGELAPIAS